MVVASTLTDVRLAPISRLLAKLHKQQILYCHWKSNEHLQASMEGRTDLDVLFLNHDRERVEYLLEEIGFKRFMPVAQRRYRDIEDYLCLDEHSGKIVHLHTHFRLTLGEPHLKSYQLDCEQPILETRVYDQVFDIYRIAPSFELVLLFIREALKVRNRNRLGLPWLSEPIGFENSVREYQWLMERADSREVHAILETLLKNPDPVFYLMKNGFTKPVIARLSVVLRKELKTSRLYSPLRATIERWQREASLLVATYVSRWFQVPIPSRRINPRGGKVVALVGADGSGKSTLTRHLVNCFGEKLDVFKIYFGRGDGDSSNLRRVLGLVRRLVRGERVERKKLKQVSMVSQQVRPVSMAATFYKTLEAVLVAREKIKNLRRMKKAREKGMLVISDRFPQNQVMGINDGPLLNAFKESGNSILRAIARWEFKVYQRASDSPPDLLIKLITEADIVEKRKPGETSLARLQEKIQGIKGLSMKDGCVVMTIDTSKPLLEVQEQVRREVWRLL